MKHNSDKYNILNDDEDGFDQKTPKVLSSNEGSDDEEAKEEDRPLQRVNFKVLEELVEESREESMRGDSNVQSHAKVYIKGRIAEDIENLDEVRKGSIIEREVQPTNRMYDSDIFVMSNTTFDEELASLSSRRVSASK
jgi:hypothetical protein